MKPGFFVTMFLLMIGTRFSSAEPPKIVGSWKIEIVFADGEMRELRFDAQDAGKGSFTLLTPKPVSVGQAKGTAEWTKSEQGKITFSGPVQFPLGNVGLLQGKLVLQGQLQSDHSIAGEATFFRSEEGARDQENKPSKNGTFKATRTQE